LERRWQLSWHCPGRWFQTYADPSTTVLRLGGLDPAVSHALLRENSPWLTPLQERRVLDGAGGNPLDAFVPTGVDPGVNPDPAVSP
jgi:hypothetical protein